MSLGLHRVWKDYFVQKLKPVAGMQVLDAAAGTGDIAFRLWQREPNLSLTLLDPNEQMLTIAQTRARALGIRMQPPNSDAREATATWPAQPRSPHGYMRFVVSAAEYLPFSEASFDAYTISFGMRNTTEPLRAMQEAYRVLRRGGRFLMMEFGRVPDSFPLVQRLYDAYSFTMIPQLGAWIARDRDAYLYLVESIRAFPDQRKVCAMMHQVGFQEVTFEDLSFGVVSIYSGWKLDKNLPDLGSVEQLQGS